MPVRPIAFQSDGNSIQIACDHCGYTGWVDTNSESNIRFDRDCKGDKDFRFILVECPVCLAETNHPVSGGCDRENVQKMFAFLYNHDPDQPATNAMEALTYIQQYCEQLGEGLRFALHGWSPDQETQAAG